MAGEVYPLPDALGNYLNAQGQRVRLAGVDALRVIADEQLRQVRRIGVPLAPEPGLQVERPDSLGQTADRLGLVPAGRMVRAEDYFTGGKLADGQSSSVLALSRALAACKRFGYALDLRGGVWRVDLLGQLQLHSDLVIYLTGAKILGPERVTARGVLFTGTNVDNVRLVGGEVIGYRDTWDAPAAGQAANLGTINNLGRNIRPFVFAGGSRVEADGVRFRDWNAPAVSADNTTDVTLRGCRFTRNSAYYYDYVEPTQPYPGGGPAVNSQEADKGQYHLWGVERFNILGCTVEGAAGDSSHVKNSLRGTVTGNQIILNKMGGAYYEACSDVSITGNLQWQNGSRGTTVEANSSRITFNGNIVGLSGREGYWGWGVNSGTIVGNVFYQNGQKAVSGLTTNILLAPFVAATPAACDVTVAHNYSETWAGQEHNMRVASYISGINIHDNTLRGPVRTVRVDAYLSGFGSVRVRDNDGWATETEGRTALVGDGATTQFVIPHGLDFSDPADNRMLNHVKIRPRITPLALLPSWAVTAMDTTNMTLTFAAPLANGQTYTVDWEAKVR